MPACCAAAVSPAFGFPRIRRKALFPGLTGRRHPLGSPADAVEGRYVGGLHPPQAAPPYVPHLDGSCPLPPAARRWDLSAARPRAATVQEGDIAVRALLELGRGTVKASSKSSSSSYLYMQALKSASTFGPSSSFSYEEKEEAKRRSSTLISCQVLEIPSIS
ncbi:uncharacterized protein [Aegilops tauschii subsp. strangulata]|uniref:uncharacterized protein n=1 Tax=Aegilops tauschii subsp. strangulata TaxID=200361 RepID=UPI00098B9008